MTEILELAQAISDTKEELRQAIISHGVSCDKNVKFAQYPSKVKQVQRDPAFKARNDLGVTEIEEGTKVFVQPLEQEAGTEVKFYNALQFKGWGCLNLYPSSETKFVVSDGGANHSAVGLYSWTEEEGLTNIYTTYNDNDYSNYRYYKGYNIYSPTIIGCKYMNDYYAPSNFFTPDGAITLDSNVYLLQHGYAIKNPKSSGWTIWKYDTQTGELLEQVGIDAHNEYAERSAIGQLYISPDCKYLLTPRDGGVLWENNDGAFTESVSKWTDSWTGYYDILQGYNYYNVLGGTKDGKYMIINRYSDSADSDGVQNYPLIVGLSEDLKTMTPLADLALTGLPTWYPWLETLVMKNAQGKVRMLKYTNGEWVEVSLDFPDEFTSGIDNCVTLNYDGSLICVQDSTDYKAGVVYVYRLAVSGNNTYKCIPATPFNYNSNCYTAYTTGTIDETTVEVNALLPTLPNDYNVANDIPLIVKQAVI